MSFAGVYKLGEQPTVGERLEETRKVKQGGMGNGTTGKEGLGDLNEMKSVKKCQLQLLSRSLVDCHSLNLIIIVRVSQSVRNRQPCHQEKPSLRKKNLPWKSFKRFFWRGGILCKKTVLLGCLTEEKGLKMAQCCQSSLSFIERSHVTMSAIALS